jgi:anti-sigma factor (TIGR02949 family)
MHCETVYASLQEYVDGQLSPAETQAVEDHLATCAACRAELALLRQVDNALAQQPILEAPADLTARIMAQVRATAQATARLPAPAPPPSPFRLRWQDAAISAAFAWAAVTILVALFLLWPPDVAPPQALLQEAWWTWVPRADRLWHTARLEPAHVVGMLSGLCIAGAAAASAAVLARQCLKWTATRP